MFWDKEGWLQLDAPLRRFATDDAGGGSAGSTAGDADQQGQSGTGDQSDGDAGKGTGGDQEAPPPATYEDWYGGLEESAKGLLDGHVTNLKSALDDERAQRKDLGKQLRAASAKLEAGSEAKKSLDAMTERMEEVERRAQFYEEGGKSEIGCTDLKLAYLAAGAGDYFSSSGRVDWSHLKKDHPLLFTKAPQKLPAANAGEGGGQQGAPTADMNAFIRQTAGRR